LIRRSRPTQKGDLQPTLLRFFLRPSISLAFRSLPPQPASSQGSSFPQAKNYQEYYIPQIDSKLPSRLSLSGPLLSAPSPSIRIVTRIKLPAQDSNGHDEEFQVPQLLSRLPSQLSSSGGSSSMLSSSQISILSKTQREQYSLLLPCALRLALSFLFPPPSRVERSSNSLDQFAGRSSKRALKPNDYTTWWHNCRVQGWRSSSTVSCRHLYVCCADRYSTV
jgi:hypothetical protein